MKNKGQTTIFFTMMISIFILFTFTALEIERIYTSRIKIRGILHSTQTNIMADYNAELFEKYHLLFLDPTYGTNSTAVLEEKIIDYLNISLNGKENEKIKSKEFKIEDVAVIDYKTILDKDMELLKKQIVEYEKSAGIPKRAKNLFKNINKKDVAIEEAWKETEINGVEMEENNPKEEVEKNEEKIEVTDPRDSLKNIQKTGILSFIFPSDKTLKKEEYLLDELPSKKYLEEKEENEFDFQNIDIFKNILKQNTKKEESHFFLYRIATLDYYSNHFSNGVHPINNSKMACEAEYILKGKTSDYENMEAVIKEMLWNRFPINYAYLLTDTKKKSEALTLATTICMATGTEGLIEVVKYLLLGCWSYGESLYEMKRLTSGEEIDYIKTKESWYTDLETPGVGKGVSQKKKGISYEDFLLILLAKKSEKNMNVCYARMLDVMQINIKETNPDFNIINCVGELNFQGKINTKALFINKSSDLYEYYFDEKIAY